MPLERPRLKAHLTAEVIGADRAFVIGEERAVLLDRASDVGVLELVNGHRTVEEIVGELAGRFSIADVFRSISKLEALNLLADGRPGELPEREIAYWDAVGVDAAGVAQHAPTVPVTMVGQGDVDLGAFAAVWNAAGIKTSSVAIDEYERPATGELTVVVAGDYLAPDLVKINEAMLAAGSPWLLVRPSGVRAWLGPLFVPGSTGCWQCLRQRVHENLQVERYLNGRRGAGERLQTASPEPPAGATTVAGLLLSDLIEWLLTGHSPRLEGRLITLDRLTLATQPHTLIRQPQCPSCGDPTLITQRDPRATLVPRETRFRSDGGYRTEPPEQTFERLSKHISPLLGAVSSLHPVTESEAGVTHAYTAGHNFALLGDNIPLLRRNLRGQSGGKGRTDVQARVSAIAEAIERYSGVWRGNEPVRRASYDDLSGERRVHIEEILLFSDQQYAERMAELRDPTGRFNVVPERFRTDLPCDWSTAWSLTRDEPVLVPAGHVWFGHPDIEEHFFTFGDGNGNASGSVLEEAILQATCELIERDSVAIWWYNRLVRPEFDLASLDDPYVETLRRYYASLDRDFWVLDITSDLGVPTCAAVSARRAEGAPQDVIVAFGAHLDPYLAAMRALTEMNQFLPAVSHRRPDGSTLYLEDDPGALDWWKTVRVENEPWLRGSAAAPSTIDTHPRLVRESLTSDLQGLLDLIAAAGLEVLVVDQSRPDLELSVVKVMIPGLRHFWRRLAPGRLYDVPVAMGWLSAPLREDDLNPKSVFF